MFLFSLGSTTQSLNSFRWSSGPILPGPSISFILSHHFFMHPVSHAFFSVSLSLNITAHHRTPQDRKIVMLHHSGSLTSHFQSASSSGVIPLLISAWPPVCCNDHHFYMDRYSSLVSPHRLWHRPIPTLLCGQNNLFETGIKSGHSLLESVQWLPMITIKVWAVGYPWKICQHYKFQGTNLAQSIQIWTWFMTVLTPTGDQSGELPAEPPVCRRNSSSLTRLEQDCRQWLMGSGDTSYTQTWAGLRLQGWQLPQQLMLREGMSSS